MKERQSPIPVALYARVFRDGQDVWPSAADQLSALRDYADRNGYAVVREYADETENPEITSSPQFRIMVAEGGWTNAPFREILIWGSSRLPRQGERAFAAKSRFAASGIRVVAIEVYSDDSPTGLFVEEMDESADQFFPENSAHQGARGMHEAASKGFWVSGHTPFGYIRVVAPDGLKKRPSLELDPNASCIVKRIFDMADAGKGTLDIARTLNSEGIASPRGKHWGKTSVHAVLTNEAYTGTLLWGVNAKDKGDPVRVEKAFPAIVSMAQFRRVRQRMSSRAPRFSHPRRLGNPHLLSGLVKCQNCHRALSGHHAKGGRYSYYVCQSIMKQGKEACNTPRLSAPRLETLVIERIRSNFLTENNVRELVGLVDEELEGIASEQRQKLDSIESELSDVRGRPDRNCDLMETKPDDQAGTPLQSNHLWDRQGRLEASAAEAAGILSRIGAARYDVEAIVADPRELNDLLSKSEPSERRAFVEAFVEQIVTGPGQVKVHYTMPTPEDSRTAGMQSEEVAIG